MAHEALLRNWDTLRGWLDGDRVDHRVHRDLTEAAEKWAQRERDTSSLYQGVDLEEAKRLRTARSDDLNALEREFIGASQTFADRELAAATAQAASLQRRLIVAGVALLIAVALAATSVAFAARARTAQQRADDRTAEALEATSRAEQSETVAQSALQDAQESESEAKDAREQAVLAASESERLGTEATACTGSELDGGARPRSGARCPARPRGRPNGIDPRGRGSVVPGRCLSLASNVRAWLRCERGLRPVWHPSADGRF